MLHKRRIDQDWVTDGVESSEASNVDSQSILLFVLAGLQKKACIHGTGFSSCYTVHSNGLRLLTLLKYVESDLPQFGKAQGLLESQTSFMCWRDISHSAQVDCVN